MTFGEKLVRLRKERGLSQEALAEQLGTTRQAISKWENHQGFPETEKLLLLSSLFSVSIDSMLKGDFEQAVPAEDGTYVSRECAERFLAFRRKTTLRTAAGVSVLILAGVPYALFSKEQVLAVALACAVMIAGLAFLLSMAMLGDPYRGLSRGKLLFDPPVHAEFIAARQVQRRKALVRIVAGAILVSLAGILGLAGIPAFPTSAVQCTLAACAVFLWIRAVGSLDAYEVLTQSEERRESVCARLMQRIRR